eukprot:1485780-Prymnesium_polylepis.2
MAHVTHRLNKSRDVVRCLLCRDALALLPSGLAPGEFGSGRIQRRHRWLSPHPRTSKAGRHEIETDPRKVYRDDLEVAQSVAARTSVGDIHLRRRGPDSTRAAGTWAFSLP